MSATAPFSPRGAKSAIEEGDLFTPLFNADGLIPVITQDHHSGDVLMFAYMTASALQLTVETGLAHYWSRSRKALWKKGETSGEMQRVVSLRTDCDQDVLLMRVEVTGRGASCHTGRVSCFYRQLRLKGAASGEFTLEFTDEARLFDPETVYPQK